MRFRLLFPGLLALCSAHPGAVQAADADAGAPVVPVVPLPPPPPPAPSPWATEGRLGLFFSNTATHNADVSRDPTIGGASSQMAVLGTVDLKAVWTDGKNSVDHLLKARYGRTKSAGDAFLENEDEARYDGVYRRELSKPHFIYLGWGIETVWTGPHRDDPTQPPDDPNNPFDPLLAHVGTGYGQRYQDWAPTDAFEWRLGVRAQKSWGSQLTDDQERVETGPELYARYEGTPISYHKDLKYFAQYEAFAEFADLRHVSNLITAGLTFQFAKHLNLELALRAHYESRPKEDRDAQVLPGYNSWAIKQDTLVGVVYTF
jgi:hypothetical protein